ncbi:Mitochondrial protein Surfeit 1/SURF1/SHY1, required for expression of cytochrome oxidase [Phaffia rhodozyma]|uniref:SURF1-like protein n=1 Tax=Phaffia rhodozyma TaxID=264483 RepID=A0A0F7SM31_PHARH|nr:Mitochondrial protein Surfeit 1/SURF1/SHY1, required for expression of cytochrome oxidase [Phaffia rhodozyma]
MSPRIFLFSRPWKTLLGKQLHQNSISASCRTCSSIPSSFLPPRFSRSGVCPTPRISSIKALLPKRTYTSSSSPPPPLKPRVSPPTKRESDYTIHLVVLAAVPLFCAYLGYWQIQRLQWKLELIDELEANLARTPMVLPDVLDIDTLTQYNYRKILVTGHYPSITDSSFPRCVLIGPRVYQGDTGYQLIVPFVRSSTDPESTSPPTPFLLNAGFVRKDIAEQGPQAIKLPPPDEEITVEAMLRNEGQGKLWSSLKGQKPTRFTPDNDYRAGLWYWVDAAGFADYYSREAGLDGDAPREMLVDQGVPTGRPARIELRNQHAVYALTWFSIAAVTSVLWVKVFRLGRTPKAKIGRMGQ